MMTAFIFSALGGYLLGSVPFGLVLTRMAGLGDIRKIGSGNIGATNVLRTGRKDLALLTVLLDAFKAGIAALVAKHLVTNEAMIFCEYLTSVNTVAALIAGTAAVIGHNFPVWLRFKGGKGVASAFGFILVLSPAVAGLALLTWLVVAFVTRKSGLDIAHVGVLCYQEGEWHFIHASSLRKKVVIEPLTLSEYLKKQPMLLGIRVLRVH